MSLFSLFMDSIRQGKVSEWIPDFEYPDQNAHRVYLKKLAIDTNLNFVGRTMSTLKVNFKNKNAPDWEYILNVRPNSDMSAADFWQKFVYKLMFDNEVLVIMTTDNQLLIADDYHRREYAVYEDVFENVIVKDYQFKKTFPMSKVLYLDYNNAKLDAFTDGLFSDYGELFGRILEVAMRNNQIRGSVSIDATGTFKDKLDEKGKTRTQQLQEYLDKVYNSFRKNSVAIVPKTKGFDYEEYTNKQGVSNQSLEELNTMKRSLIDDVANMIGIPTALLYGEKSELDSNLTAYKKLCIDPLVKQIQDELTNKLLYKSEYEKGARVEVSGVLLRDPLELASQIDKLAASSTFLIDEVREMNGFDPLPNGQGQKLLRTKNYEEVENLKGGEGEE